MIAFHSPPSGNHKAEDISFYCRLLPLTALSDCNTTLRMTRAMPI